MNVPKLRFKEFTGEWEEKLIGDCFVKINDRNKTKSINNVISNTAKYGLVKQEEYFDKDIAIQENTENYYVIDKGDFVYNPRKSVEAPYGPIRLYQLEETGIVSPLYLCFRSKNKLFDYFYNYFFQSSKWYRYIYRNGDSGARADRVNIKDEVFFSLNTFLPIMDEQEKIVDFLNIVCKKINNQQAVVESLEKQKKGLMQKIFSQELRFKDDDGKEFPAWKEKKFSDVFNFLPTNTYSREDASFVDGVIQNIHYGDILTKYSSLIDLDRVKLPYLSSKIEYEEEKLEKSKIKDGDIVIADTAEDYTVGKVCEVTNIRQSIVVAGLHTMLCRVTKGVTFTSGYLGYYMNSSDYHNQLLPLIVGTKVSSIAKREIVKTKLRVPCLREQKKIVKLFVSLDAKIEKEKLILEHWQKIKKGLLQQMFV